MLSRKLFGFHTRLSSCCRICRSQLSASSIVMQNGAPMKRKWKTSEIETLLEWRRVTEEVFGPVVNVNSLNTGQLFESKHPLDQKYDKVSRKSLKKISVSSNSVGFPANPSTNEPNGETFLHGSSSCQVSDDDSTLFFVSNYSETKHVQSTEHEIVLSALLPGAKTQQVGLLSQVKKDGKVPSSWSDSTDTFDYKWEDQPPEETIGESPVIKEVAITKSISIDVPDVTSNGVSSDAIISADLQSRITRQTFESPSSGVYRTLNAKQIDSDKLSMGIEEVKPLPIVRGVNDGLQSYANENFVTSFPLFLTEFDRTQMKKAAVGRVPSVTKILQATQSPESRKILEKWEKQMIAELGEAGFAQYKADTFANGSNLHTSIELYLTGRSDEIKIREGNEGHWQSIEPLLDCVTGVQYVEHPVRHSDLKYAGIVDCIAEFRGNPCIIEWKTSQRRKANLKSTFDNPLQLVAYLGAYNSQPTNSLQLEQCVLVICYSDGNAADVHVMKRKDCVQYWNAWLTRLNQYHRMSKTVGSALP